MLPNKSPLEGSLVVAALITLGIVFAGHWIVSYVQNGNPWAITPGMAASQRSSSSSVSSRPCAAAAARMKSEFIPPTYPLFVQS